MVKEEVNKPGIFYLHIHKNLAEHSINFMIKQKDAISYLHQWRIPKHLRIAMLKELEGFGLIKKQPGKQRMLIISKPNKDLCDISVVYKYVGIL